MSNPESGPAAQAEVEAPPGAIAGLVILLIVALIIVGWILVGAQVFGLSSFYASFLLLWFWANNEKLEIKRLPSATLGALYGLGLAWAVSYLPVHHGNIGLAIALGLLLGSLYIQICNWVPWMINASAMLFLTVAGAPAIIASVDWIEIGKAVLFSAIFFAVIVEGLKWLAAKFGPKPAG